MSSRKLDAVDLFSGAGGFLAAAELQGFHTVAATDIEPDAIGTLRKTQSACLPIPGQPGRHFLEGTRILEKDIHELRGSDLRPNGASSSWRPDLLSGGPPCQPFSSAGKRRGLRDPRGTLFEEFVRLAAELRPRYVVFENVRGLLTQKGPNGRPGGVLRAVQRSFEAAGFAVRVEILNAADYGAAQRRVRLYLVASSDLELPDFPLPTHGQGLGKPWRPLSDMLDPAPNPEDLVLPSGKRKRSLLALKPGTGIKTGGLVEANRPSGHWGYKQDCFHARLDIPSRTIRAASTPDWVTPPSGTMRRLTWKECAALQGFPGEWQFVGNKASRFRQIGNAVCSAPTQAIFREIRNALQNDGPAQAQPVSQPWPDEFHRRIAYTWMEQRVNGSVRRAPSRERVVV